VSGQAPPSKMSSTVSCRPVVSVAWRSRALRPLADRLPSGAGTLWLGAVALSPTAKTMVVAGGTGLRPCWVTLANVTGTLARVLVIWTAGRAFPAIGQAVAALAPWIAIPGCLTAIALVAVRCRRGLRVARAAA
jgi:hypothetical protein